MVDSSSAPATFLWREKADGVVICYAHGDIDLTGRAEIRRTFARAAARARTGIVVDLSDVGFCDSTGLNALLNLRLEAAVNGAIVVLAGPSPQLVRLLQVVGADAVLPTYPSVREALDALATLDDGAGDGSGDPR